MKKLLYRLLCSIGLCVFCLFDAMTNREYQRNPMIVAREWKLLFKRIWA